MTHNSSQPQHATDPLLDEPTEDAALDLLAAATTARASWRPGDPDPVRPPIAPESALLLHENLRERHFVVDANFDGWRLDRFLASRLARLSRDKANAIAKHGDIGLIPPTRRARPSLKLATGDTVVLRQRLPPEWVQDAQVVRLYEDDDVLILSKPAGMLVHESANVRLNSIQLYLERRGELGTYAVHRLDRETSGVLVCGRNARIIPPLSQLFATDHPKKVYRALVLDPHHRWRAGDRHTITTPLGPVLGRVLTVRMGLGDLSTITHVEAVGEREHPTFGRMSDLVVTIETGRQHQIRAHLEMAGTPIAGDKLYGQTDAFFMATCDRPDDLELLSALPFPRHALHAWRLELPHPARRGERLTVEAPLPEELWG